MQTVQVADPGVAIERGVLIITQTHAYIPKGL